MKKLIILIMGCLLSVMASAAEGIRYGEEICLQPDYVCHKVKRGESWGSLFPNAQQRDIAKRLNRMNIGLEPGMVIAIPKHLPTLTIYDISPFPRYIKAPGEKLIQVSQKALAWGAYDPSGELVWWGPISTGKDYCKDMDGECHTPTGSFRFFRKEGIDCISALFPVRRYGVSGGATMPYCIYFDGGYALHGSEEVPGYRASHGCVRLFWEDARWLNTEFIELDNGRRKGTRVEIEDL